MKLQKRFHWFVAAAWFAAAFHPVSNARAEYESASYVVDRSDGGYEIRDYPSLTLASTSMESDGMNAGFRRLFRFIDGGNDRSQKIAMTTPVFVDSGAESRTMSFVVSRDVALKGVPQPTGEKVELAKSEAARFAVFRFSGWRTVENETAALGKLKAWLEAQKIASDGPVRFAYYDPPWTPPFMRRNEVMIRINSK